MLSLNLKRLADAAGREERISLALEVIPAAGRPRERFGLAFDPSEEITPLINGVDGQSQRECEVVDAEFRQVGILPELPGVIFWPEDARILTTKAVAVVKVGRQHHAGRSSVRSGANEVEPRGVTRPVGARRHVRGAWGHLVDTGEHHMCRVLMTRHPVSHRSHDRELLRSRGETGKMLTDTNARSGGVDRLKRPAYLFRGLRFGVECVDLARRTGLKDEQDRLCPRDRRGGPSLTSPKRRQTKPEETRVTDLDQLPASQSRRVLMDRRGSHLADPRRSSRNSHQIVTRVSSKLPVVRQQRRVNPRSMVRLEGWNTPNGVERKLRGGGEEPLNGVEPSTPALRKRCSAS